MYVGDGRRRDPARDLACYKTCLACLRCEDKGKYDKCFSCSGRGDPELKRDPYDFDDRCRCKEGILQVRMQNGKLVQSKFPSNPFKGNIRIVDKSPDERDYDSYVQEQREKLDDPNFNPIQRTD